MKARFSLGLLLATSMLAACGKPPSVGETTQGATPPDVTWLEPPQSASYVPGQVIVKKKDAYATRTVTGVRQIQSLGSNAGVYAIEAGESVEQAVRRLQADPGVALVEPNYVYKASATTNDPRLSSLWGLAKIQASQAWDQTQGAPELTVAVIDTGVDYNHPDLAGQVIKGYDYVNGDADPMDDQGHGTHVAGTIAAVGNNATGIVGVSYKTRVIAYKVLGAQGEGSTSWIIQALADAQKAGAKVVNMSLGGPSYSSSLKDAVDKATAAGILVVAAAGNENTSTPSYPAAYPSVVSVGATDSSDRRASFSNYGSTVDVAAPGVNILSTSQRSYVSHSGTSMASPHVAGAAALLLSKNPQATPDQLRAALVASGEVTSGFGTTSIKRLNLVKALGAIGTAPLPADGIAPSTPTGLKATATSETTVHLQWSASTDNVGVAGYRIYRNGTLVGTSATTSYSEGGLSAGTSYRYSVSAYDDAGNASLQSVATELSLPAVGDLAISGVGLTALSKDSAALRYATSIPAGSHIEYTTSSYYWYGYWWKKQGPAAATSHEVTLGNLKSGTVYYLRIVATDASGKTVKSGLYGFRTY